MTNETLGKFLSYLLRHNPQKLSLSMDKEGYVNVEELISKINATEDYKNELSFDRLQEIVDTNNKHRYSFNTDKTKIRASQGHTIGLNIGKEKVPPVILYHGTSKDAYLSIKKQGIKKLKRDFVHLSQDVETATNVGMRHAKRKENLMILAIDCKTMLKDGYKFYISDNDVWLSDFIPPKYISIHKEK